MSSSLSQQQQQQQRPLPRGGNDSSSSRRPEWLPPPHYNSHQHYHPPRGNNNHGNGNSPTTTTTMNDNHHPSYNNHSRPAWLDSTNDGTATYNNNNNNNNKPSNRFSHVAAETTARQRQQPYYNHQQQFQNQQQQQQYQQQYQQPQYPAWATTTTAPLQQQPSHANEDDIYQQEQILRQIQEEQRKRQDEWLQREQQQQQQQRHVDSDEPPEMATQPPPRNIKDTNDDDNRRRSWYYMGGGCCLVVILVIVLAVVLSGGKGSGGDSNGDNNNNNTTTTNPDPNEPEPIPIDFLRPINITQLLLPQINDGNNNDDQTTSLLYMDEVFWETYPYANDADGSSGDNDESKKINLWHSAADELYLLVETNGVDVWKPVARSYGGHAWEPYLLVEGGGSAGGQQVSTSVACADTYCTIELVSLLETEQTHNNNRNLYMPETQTQYAVTRRTQRRNPRDTAARFLEQVTFGTVREELEQLARNMDATTNDDSLILADWLHEQMYKVPATSHRAFYRRHSTSRFESSYQGGTVTHPCQAGAAYRRFVFTEKHHGQRLRIVHQGGTTNNNWVVLMVANRVLSVLLDSEVTVVENGAVVADGRYQICERPETFLGGTIMIQRGGSCVAVAFGSIQGNPPVQFAPGSTALVPGMVELTLSTTHVETLDLLSYNAQKGDNAQRIVTTRALTEETCRTSLNFDRGGPIPIVFGKLEGQYYAHDPRFVFLENTVESPLSDGGGSLVESTINQFASQYQTACSNAPRSFLNQDSCVLSKDVNACSQAQVTTYGLEVTLDEATLQKFYELTNSEGQPHYIYAMKGLRILDDVQAPPPCQPLARSRWIPVPELTTQAACHQQNGNAVLGDDTITVLSALLTQFSDGTDLVRDIFLPSNTEITCNVADQHRKGFHLFTQQQGCFQNVHPNHLQVYDMTMWPDLHPGGPANIEKWAESGSAFLQYSTSHVMQRWQDNKDTFVNLGRLGERIDFGDLSSGLQSSPAVVAHFFETSGDDIFDVASETAVVVCGGVNEVSNDLSLGGETDRGSFDTMTAFDRTSNVATKDRERLWTTVSVTAPDQLRQRVAWALSQLFVVNNYRHPEAAAYYYDIFVRNAFGSFRDILKEISTNSMMGRMLTFLDSRSTSYVWSRDLQLEYPDENFAREILQLFPIGLYELNDDGSARLDNDGRLIRTYGNGDIEEYSRAWTGFREQQDRGNVNQLSRTDPMYIRLEWRDSLPKMGLGNKYIGHGFPRCIDLPEQHFLAKGAKYVLLGSKAKPELHTDPSGWINDPLAVKFAADPQSQLNAALCKKNGSSCSYPPIMVLESNLACRGIECNTENVRMIEVEGGIFYEYVRPPCVRHAFSLEPRKIKNRRRDYMCVDAREHAARAACCYQENNNRSRSYILEDYWGERVTAAHAEKICESNQIEPIDEDHSSFSMCQQPYDPIFVNCDGSQCQDSRLQYAWWSGTSSCQIKAKIDKQGRVAIAHFAPDEGERASVDNLYSEDSKTFFRVLWNAPGEIRQFVDDCPSKETCKTTTDGFCSCDTEVVEETAYESMPTREQVLALPIGSVPPESALGPFMTTAEGSVKVHAEESAYGRFSAKSIFEVTDDNGVTQLRRNLLSRVQLTGTSLSFLNPVHFIARHDEALRDAWYETEATLDSYFYHRNVGPFVSTHFAKRFGVSNPSTTLIKSMTAAFRSGRFDFGGVQFGSGSYGDLGALLAAMLLNSELRNTLLDNDASFGSLKEPLLKVTALLRNLEFQATPAFPFFTLATNMQDRIGQMVFKSPTVFNFFLPEFQPNEGRISSASLVSPEAELLTSPTIISLMNGLLSSVKYGLDRCYAGLAGDFAEEGAWSNCRYRKPGDFVNSTGFPNYSPSSQVVRAALSELATIMTSGRLSTADRELIIEETRNAPDPQQAMVQAQQLIVGSSAFHSTGIVNRTGGQRSQRDDVKPSDRPYRAVIVVFLAGGMDSYNMIVPSSCDGTNEAGLDVLQQYIAERGEVGLNEGERNLVLDVRGPNQQPCDKFAVHPSLPFVQQLYDDEDLSFFLNAGVINNPTNKENYQGASITQLFAHNSMQHEAGQIDPNQEIQRSGILGRISHVLNGEDYGFRAQTIGIQSLFNSLGGDNSNAPPPLVMSDRGPESLAPRPWREQFDPQDPLIELNGPTDASSSVFGDTWSSLFTQAINDNEFFETALDGITLENEECGSRALNVVIKMMETRNDRGVDRDLFQINFGGWDDHAEMKANLGERFVGLNEYLECFVNNAKAKGLWDEITLITMSEFGRTLTPNTNYGTDHAWGGHAFAMGGGLKGELLGQYPFDITPDSPLNVGRGRMIPTLSWESIWTSIIEWLGVKEEDFDYVLPNAQQTDTPLLRRDQVFNN